MTLKQSLVCQKKISRNNYKQLAGGCYLRIVMEPARHACYHTGLGDADVPTIWDHYCFVWNDGITMEMVCWICRER